MARKANYGHEKRQREIKKQKKKEAKAEKKRLEKEAEERLANGEELDSDDEEMIPRMETKSV